MKELTRVERFYKFLEGNNCKEEFIKNYSESQQLSIEEARKNLYMDLLLSREELYVVKSFPWAHTSEGFAFWLGVHRKWKYKQ